MKNQIYPCLWFDGKAKEATEFYCSFIENSRIRDNTPMVVTFELNGKLVMGLNGGPMFKFNPAISFFVSCGSVDETDEIWNKLFEGGSALIPIGEYPWSERYGWLQDMFGFTWQVSVSNNKETNLKLTPSMLFTGRMFGKAEEAINFYSSVFDKSSTDTLIHYPVGDSNQGKVLYSEFKLNKYPIIAMDGPGVHDYSFNEAVSFVVNCKKQEEIDYFWEKLTDGGVESMCGWLQDKYGVSWQIVPSVISKLMADTEKATAVIQALMKMKKPDIETLLKA